MLTPTPENNTQGLGEQMQNSNEVTQWCQQIYLSPTTKYQFSYRDMGNNTKHMVFEGELAVKLHAKDVEVGTSLDINPRQDHVTMRRAHGPGSTITTKAFVFLGLCIMHQ